MSIGPGGGLSIGPGGGQSIGPGGGQSIGPGGGQDLNRDPSRGLDPNTLRPYPDAFSAAPAVPSPGGRVLNPGMSRQEVLLAMGPPVKRETGGGREAWHYCKTGLVDQFLVVVFNEGRAVSSRRYQVTLEDTGGVEGDCSEFTRSALQ